MIMLHGLDGEEIYLDEKKIISVTSRCLNDSPTKIIVDARMKSSEGIVNLNYEVIELIDDILSLISRKISKREIEEKYKAKINEAKENYQRNCLF